MPGLPSSFITFMYLILFTHYNFDFKIRISRPNDYLMLIDFILSAPRNFSIPEVVAYLNVIQNNWQWYIP